jgi:hypothetical protein
MAINIITPDDLQKFKRELLEEIERLIKNLNGQPSKKWLKSADVRKMLGISPGTLQNMRVNGTLPYTKIGGVVYYDYDDIKKMLAENRIHHRLKARFRD